MKDEILTMYFDGARSQSKNGAGIVFISPMQETLIFSCILEFEATNNVVEYESLLPGLELAKEMGIKFLEVFGDSKLIIFQVKKITPQELKVKTI
jgi:ribonuclease HI